jgi:small-conductance mechanosensitive channel
VDFLFSSVERGIPVIPGLVPELAAPTRQLARWLSYILALIVIFPYLPGSGSPAFQGVGIFVGLMVSLGSSGPIGNIVSGIVLTYSRSFTVGDRVRIADTTGDIISAGLVSTKVLTIKNEEVTIPNSTILGNHIVNYTKRASQQGLILHTGVTIGYDAPWRTVHKLLTEAALATDGVLHEPLPFVLQTSLDDSYVAYEINAYTRDAGRMVVIYSDLRQNIQDIFNAAGVEIMSPHYAALRDGNTVTTPPDDRPAGYVPGSFRLRGETMPGPSGPTGGRGAGPGGGQVG